MPAPPGASPALTPAPPDAGPPAIGSTAWVLPLHFGLPIVDPVALLATMGLVMVVS